MAVMTSLRESKQRAMTLGVTLKEGEGQREVRGLSNIDKGSATYFGRISTAWRGSKGGCWGRTPPPPPPPPQERSSRSLKPIYGGKGRGQAGGELAGAGLAEGWAAHGAESGGDFQVCRRVTGSEAPPLTPAGSSRGEAGGRGLGVCGEALDFRRITLEMGRLSGAIL